MSLVSPGKNPGNSDEKQEEEKKSKIKKTVKRKSFIISGNQRSFGDVALNDKSIVSMRNFNKVIHFDIKKGIIELESGMLLKEVLPIIVAKGWIFPVTPGTKYVSMGGMAANNINGKNTKKNQIKFYIKKIKLLCLDKKIVSCSVKSNKKLFDLTVGGFGLTGIILFKMERTSFLSCRVDPLKISTWFFWLLRISFNCPEFEAQ